jgi:hypothetical protein
LDLLKKVLMDVWDFAIQDAVRALEGSLATLRALERKRPVSRHWKHEAPYESALALARRQVTIDRQTLRAARLRALNGRIERIRRGAPTEAPPPFTPDLFSGRR